MGLIWLVLYLYEPYDLTYSTSDAISTHYSLDIHMMSMHPMPQSHVPMIDTKGHRACKGYTIAQLCQ